MDCSPHPRFISRSPDKKKVGIGIKKRTLNLNLQGWVELDGCSSSISPVSTRSSRNSEPGHERKVDACIDTDGSQASILTDEELSLTLGFSSSFESKSNSVKDGIFLSGFDKDIDERTHCKHLGLDLGLLTSSPHQLVNDYLAFNRRLDSREDGSEAASEPGNSVYQGNSKAKHPEFSSVAVTDVNADADAEVKLQLGLSGSLTTQELSPSLDIPVGTRNAHLHGIDIAVFRHIPVVDEGSTSARFVKSGGHMPALLQSRIARANGISNLSQKSRMADANNASAHGSSSSHGVTTERSFKTCKFEGCVKGARGASGLCIAHGGGRRCQRPNCNKGAEGRTMFCKAHGGGRRCQSLGCIKSAEGKTDFCIAHGGGRRCSHEGCSKAARGKSGLCIRHGGGKRCQKEGCTKSAEGFSGLCISHGGGRRCQFPDCRKGAQGSTKFCKAHGGGRRCEFEGCTKGAEGSTPLCKAHGGGKRCTFGGGTCTKSVHGGTLYCVAHGGGKRCAAPACTKSARGRTDYCVRHGGGKRCKFDSCSKSAQGSTDFCKAHGGGKRCSWGQEGSMHNGQALHDASLTGSCDKFARGKAGLCSAHNALAERFDLSGTSTLNIQGSKAASLYSSPFSDLSEQTLHAGDEKSVDTVSQQSPTSNAEIVWRTDQSPVSRTIVFNTQPASVTNVCSSDTLFGRMPESWNPFSQLSRSVEAVNIATYGLYSQQNMQAHNGKCIPVSEAKQSIQVIGGTSEQTQNPQKGNISDMSTLYDPEERVHGGGHFMALLASKSTRDNYY